MTPEEFNVRLIQAIRSGAPRRRALQVRNVLTVAAVILACVAFVALTACATKPKPATKDQPPVFRVVRW